MLSSSTVEGREKYYNEDRGRDLRRNSDGTRHWVVSEMWDLHHEIVRRVVLGQKNVDIARALSCTPQVVSNVKNSPVAQEQIVLLRGARDAETVDLAKEIAEIAPEAMTLLKDIIRGENDGANATLGLRAKEANGMLARAGFGVPQRVQSESVNVHLTSQDIADIKRRALSGTDMVMEAEFIETETTCEESRNG